MHPGDRRAAPDLTGQIINGRTILGRGKKNTANNGTKWRYRCVECGYEAQEMKYFILRRGCRRCANRKKEKWTATTNAGKAHAASLTDPIWAKICIKCGSDFVGTARQKYCNPTCRKNKR